MKLGDFQIIDSAREQDRLEAQIRAFNRTRTDYPHEKTVPAVFVEQAKKSPQAVAVRCGEASITYRELDERSNQLARFLVQRGLRGDAFVGVLMDRSIEMVVAMLGVLKAGGAYVPLSSDTPLPRMKYLLCDTRAEILISEKSLIRVMNKMQWECPNLHSILCLDSDKIHAESEALGEMMREDMWDYIRRDMFDDISGGGWKSSYTGEWLSRAVMEEYGENIRQKLTPRLRPDSRVLEIGVASGISMFRLAPLVKEYVGADLSRQILHWSHLEVEKRGLTNVQLRHLAAHEIHRLQENDFDGVILNSVVQCFNGHNYFRDVLRQTLALMRDEGWIFLGNIWDQDLQEAFVASLQDFARDNAGKGYTTKIDRSEELFLSRKFFEDLRHDFPEIEEIECSSMLGREESELSIYGYDVLLRVRKRAASRHPLPPRHKFQFDRRAVTACSSDPIHPCFSPRQLAYLMYTSGTSGKPKGVMIEHRSILRLVLQTNYLHFDDSLRILQTGSLAFDASTFEIWGALLNGGVICFPREEDLINGAELGRLIQQFGITTIFLTTSLFNMLVAENVEIFQGLKSILTGGEKVSVPTFNRLRKAYPSLELLHVYGPTENTTFTTGYRVIKTHDKDVPIGGPIANTTVYILDSNLRLLPVGIPGELCTGGEGLARGYLNDPMLTAEKFIPHPLEPGERLYRTGDLARWLPDGSIEFLRRIDDQVKIRGYRIEPTEIECRLLAQQGVSGAVVVSGNFGGEGIELAAYVVGPPELDVDVVRERLKVDLPDYMIPAHFIKMDQLPLNANGKVDRKALPVPQAARRLLQQGRIPPASDLEKQLAAIWEEALDFPAIGVTDNFFDSGGHSLKVAKVISMIEKRMGLALPLTAIFKAPTIRALADFILDQARYGLDEIDSPIVPLRPAPSVAALFAFPPGTGDAVGYMQLAERLDPFGFYAFNFIESPDRLQQYADLVTRVDPHGPYVFLGYSSGGNLAYHVAAELEERGKRVSDLLMVDSGRKHIPYIFSRDEVEKIAGDFLNHESNRPYLASPVLREKMRRLIFSSYAWFERSVDHHDVNTDIHLLLCEASQDVYRDEHGNVVSDKQGWAEVTRGVFRTYPGRGAHNFMLSHPYVETNAEIIHDILKRIFQPPAKK